MKIFFILSVSLIFAVSCKIRPGSDLVYVDTKGPKVYRLHLSPAKGSTYYYVISNESHVKLQVGDKKTDNLNQSNTAAYYAIDKDSTGDYLLSITYDKIHLHSKNGEQETDLDAGDNPNSIDPMVKMLNALKSANIKVAVSPTGEVKAVSGYKEVGDKIVAGFSTSDGYARNIAQQRWEQLIENGLVRKNMDQLFRIFPDSAVHIGDKWTLNSREKGEFSLNTRNTFTLRSIRDGVATIDTEGAIKSDSATTKMMGYEVASDLKGRQEGEYTIETATGMLLSYRTTAKIEGTITLLGRDVPITIETSANLDGRKK